MAGDVSFGYLRWLSAGGPTGQGGTHMIPGVEVDFLTGRGGAPRHPITVGLYDYRLAGNKGHLVNFLIAKGTQMVSVDSRNPDYAGRKLCILLEDKEKSVSDAFGDMAGGMARGALTGGAISAIGAISSAAGATASTANDLWELGSAAHDVGSGAMDAVTGGAGNPGIIPHLNKTRYNSVNAYFSAFKVITITTDFAGSRRDTALRVAETGARNLNFSAIAAWAFGS